MSLNENYLRYEISGGATYYGYVINPGTTDTEKKWSIRVQDGSDVKWNANSYYAYTAIWDNKEDHFSTPSAPSIGITSSVQTNSSGNERVVLGITWSAVSGVDIYRIKIEDQNGIVYNDLGGPLQNPTRRRTGLFHTTEIFSPNYNFKGKSSMTYSITVESINQQGSSATSSTYLT